MNNEDYPGCLCNPETGRVCLFHYDLDSAIIALGLQKQEEES